MQTASVMLRDCFTLLIWQCVVNGYMQSYPKTFLSVHTVPGTLQSYLYIKHSRLTLECPDSLWNGYTAYTEICQCTLRSISTSQSSDRQISCLHQLFINF